MNALLALRTAASSVIERQAVSYSQLPVRPRPASPLLCSYIQQRGKHSQRQKKRMANHPARLRVQNRLQGAGSLESAPAASPPSTATVTAPAPTYPKVFEPELLLNGWSAPPVDQPSLIQRYPFRIVRTKNKPNSAVGFLPVYSYFRKDGTKVTTRIKKVSGNVDAFLSELHANLPSVHPGDVQHRVGGTIELKGNYVRPVKLWLASLGF